MKTSLDATALRAIRDFHEHRDADRHAQREALRQTVLGDTRRAIRLLATVEPTLSAVYLFGSILRPGCFHASSDIDVAVDGDDPAAESRLWRKLEETVDRPFDVRPRTGAVARAVADSGELVYARKAAHS